MCSRPEHPQGPRQWQQQVEKWKADKERECVVGCARNGNSAIIVGIPQRPLADAKRIAVKNKRLDNYKARNPCTTNVLNPSRTSQNGIAIIAPSSNANPAPVQPSCDSHPASEFTLGKAYLCGNVESNASRVYWPNRLG